MYTNKGSRLGIIRHPYCFLSNGISVKSSRDVRRTLSLAYTSLVGVLFCVAIPTSTVDFIQLFFMLLFCHLYALSLSHTHPRTMVQFQQLYGIMMMIIEI